MELDLTNKPPVPDYTTFHQLYAEHLDQSPSALVDSPTQESITALRYKVLDKPKLPSSAAKMFAVIDQWNSTQPISRLPLELIAHIVALGFPVTHSFEEIGKASPSYYMKALASLATISRTWRNAIIGTPSLWCLLSTSLPQHINRISIQRSGTCPLMVGAVAWVDASSADELLDLALPHWNRWSHAQLGWIAPRARIMKHLTSAAPHLEMLDFEEHEMAESESIDLFGGYAPSLQDIRVCRTSFRWDSEVFRDLRKLRLEDMDKDLISADQVLAILSASPLLELLSIDYVKVGFTPLPPPFARTPIQLPHLNSITLYGVCIGAVGNILPFIRAPNCDWFHLYAFQESNHPFDSADFLNQSFGHFDAFIRSTLALHGSTQLSLYQDYMLWACESPTSDKPPYFSIKVPFKMNTGIPWISQLLGSELPKPAHGLDVTFMLHHVDDENLAGLETLALLPNVQSFRMDYTLPSVSLMLHLVGDPKKNSGAHAFPLLKEFRLEGTCGRPLQDLEAMLMRRYGESGQSVTRPPPMRIVLAPPFCRTLRGSSDTRLQFGDLCRIRATHGVESVTLISPFGPEGMPACIYDDAEREYCNPL